LITALFSFTFEFAIREVKVSSEGLEMNGTHQLFVNDHDVNLILKHKYNKKETQTLYYTIVKKLLKK
jgi:hypothetical protein